jgi:23S rRNA (pseudouridine1915-N3)-methyltransferase
MPKLTIIAIGKIKSKAYQLLVDDYYSRLKHYTKVDLIELKDIKNQEKSKRVSLESELILNQIPNQSKIILLDEKGEKFSSKKLAQKINDFDLNRISSLSLIIGGPYGVSLKLKEKAYETWSLSTLTFPHELARATLLEQLYRAYTIIHGEKYHHE